MSKNVVVVGAQWGDEGKGKITDLISIRSIVLLVVLYYFTAICKKTKGLHPVAFIAASAVIGIVLRFGGV